MYKSLLRFFDKLEDRIRGWLSRRPIWYAIVGGVGVVLFWRGVWHTADYITERFLTGALEDSALSLNSAPWWDGPLSLVVGTIILLLVGVFVSNFIGNEIILSGLRGEKKLAEKTENEVKTEAAAIGEIREEVKKISATLEKLGQNSNNKI